MSLYENMNRRKKLGISRSKKNSTVSDKAYKNMKAGFPKPNPKRKRRKSNREVIWLRRKNKQFLKEDLMQRNL